MLSCTAVQVASENRRHKLSYHLTRQTPEQDAAVLQVGGMRGVGSAEDHHSAAVAVAVLPRC